MVLTGTGVHHIGPGDLILNAVADQEIVDAPARVVDLAGPDPLGPPGVGAGKISVHVAEGIREAFGEKIGEAFPLLVGKSCGHVVGGRVCQVDLFVGHVVVSAGNDGLCGVQTCEIVGVFPVPDLPLFKAL